MEITSLNNTLVKDIVKLQQKKHRNLSKKFLLEGYKPIKEAYDSGIKIDCVFVDKDYVNNYDFISDKIITTTPAVIKKISTTETPPNAVAVGVQKSFSYENIKDMKKVILLENIKDGGNLGTIIRSAVAFNYDGIIFYGNCIDLYNPKCVRSSVGNLWKIPTYVMSSISELDKYFHSFNRIATLPRTNNLLKNYTPAKKYVLMFGSEAEGLSPQLIDYSTDSVKIEMSEKVESLNLSVSASIIMYKLSI